jgi:hypothetical protein
VAHFHVTFERGESVGFRFGLAALLFGGAFFASIDNAFSHGFAGRRFFPATLSTDDPFVADEI